MGLTRVDRVDLAPNVPGWEALRIPAAIETAFPALPAAFGNDVKLAALAELAWGALAGVTTGVYVNLGTGIAATLVVDGQVVEGAHGAAGEIGYWLTDGTETPRMAADGGVPTEEALGGRGVARQAAALLGRPLDFAELVVRADDDPRGKCCSSMCGTRSRRWLPTWLLSATPRYSFSGVAMFVPTASQSMSSPASSHARCHIPPRLYVPVSRAMRHSTGPWPSPCATASTSRAQPLKQEVVTEDPHGDRECPLEGISPRRWSCWVQPVAATMRAARQRDVHACPCLGRRGEVDRPIIDEPWRRSTRLAKVFRHGPECVLPQA